MEAGEAPTTPATVEEVEMADVDIPMETEETYTHTVETSSSAHAPPSETPTEALSLPKKAADNPGLEASMHAPTPSKQTDANSEDNDLEPWKAVDIRQWPAEAIAYIDSLRRDLADRTHPPKKAPHDPSDNERDPCECRGIPNPRDAASKAEDHDPHADSA